MFSRFAITVLAKSDRSLLQALSEASLLGGRRQSNDRSLYVRFPEDVFLSFRACISVCIRIFIGGVSGSRPYPSLDCNLHNPVHFPPSQRLQWQLAPNACSVINSVLFYKNYLRQRDSVGWVTDTAAKSQSFKIKTNHKKKLRFWWLSIQYFLPLWVWTQIVQYPTETGRGSWDCTSSLLGSGPWSDEGVCCLGHRLE